MQKNNGQPLKMSILCDAKFNSFQISCIKFLSIHFEHSNDI